MNSSGGPEPILVDHSLVQWKHCPSTDHKEDQCYLWAEKILIKGSEEMAQQLKVLTTLKENLDSVPRIHIASHNSQ